MYKKVLGDFSGLTLKIKGELSIGDICRHKITVKKRRKTFVSFL